MGPDDGGDAGLVLGVVAENPDPCGAIPGQEQQAGLQGHQGLEAGVIHVISQRDSREQGAGIVDLIDGEPHPQSPDQPVRE